MTKAKSKPCICCTHYSGGIPCRKNHRPRLFVNGGLRRVCDDFDTADKGFPTNPYLNLNLIQRFKRLFGCA